MWVTSDSLATHSRLHTNRMHTTPTARHLSLSSLSQPEAEADDRSHNTWVYPSADFVAQEKAAEAAEPWSRGMPMFVASGSAKDAGWSAKHGRHKKTIVVLSNCPWEWVRPWAHLTHEQREKDVAYLAFKEKC